MSNLIDNCLARIKKMFTADERSESQQMSRIESARITSNRLSALQRMRENSPTTPTYKLAETTQSPTQETKKKRRPCPTVDQIDLDFGMDIRKA